MAEARAAIANRPVWVDLASADAAASREFYSKLFGWDIQVADDPQYGGYGVAKIGGQDAAGIGPKMAAEAPTAWSLYIGSTDAEETAKKIQGAGGNVIMAPFDVGDQGRMAVFQDPTGAFISAWQPKAMAGFASRAPGAFAWGELHGRGMDRAVSFYQQVFGWSAKANDIGEGNPPYTEFQVDGQSVGGGMEMGPEFPAEVPSHWLVYFGVDDVDRSFEQASSLGATPIVPPSDFPGGRFAVVTDPQGAAFGLLKMAHHS